MAAGVFADVHHEEFARPVIALSVDYPDGHWIRPHHHARAQLFYGASGVVMISTGEGVWVMPPHRGMWIPAGVVHEVRMLTPVSMRSLYLEPDVVAAMPARCQVVGISSYVRSLLLETAILEREYDLAGRAGALMTLILHEIQRLPTLPLSVPLPSHGALGRRCRAFLARPSPHATIDAWCKDLSLSRRTFTRLFRRETGLSFVAWRQQACLMAALPRLAAGEAVTRIAVDLGYDNPAAFTTMFRRTLGSPPRDYLKQDALARRTDERAQTREMLL